jgi:hypothetical protein
MTTLTTLKKITVNEVDYYVIDKQEAFCGTCDEYVTAVVEVTFADDEGELVEGPNDNWDEKDESPFCPECGETDLYEDEDAAAAEAKANYQAERADYIRKGEWWCP